MQLTGIDYFLWAAGFLAEVTLLVVLFVRHRARSFPFFTMYVADVVATAITLFLISRYGSKHAYLVGYLSTGCVDLVLQLCVLYELASHVFRPVGKWASDVRRSFIGIVCISVVVAVGLTWLTHPPARTWMRTLLIRGNFSSSILLSELFVGMVVLSATVKLPWKTHVARISQGLGVYSVIGILTEAGHSLFGQDRAAPLPTAFSYIRISSYLLCLGYWIVMLWRDAPAPRPLPEEMRTQLLSLQRRVGWDVRRIREWKT
jgi:uncharacterized membrane protein